MNIQQANEILRSITFLDFKFKLERYHEFTNSCDLHIYVTAPDTRDMSKLFSAIHVQTIYLQGMSPEHFVHYIYEAVLSVLRHEAQELFKVNGMDIFNSHEQELNKMKIETMKRMFPNHTDMSNELSAERMAQ